MMNSREDRSVLVTGANSGVGFEAAAQLAEAGWGHVILGCRSINKAAAARAALVERVARDPFDILSIDTSEVETSKRAAQELLDRGRAIDALILNAGASHVQPSYNSDGIELTWASTLVGHHVLTLRLLEGGALAENCRIIIAGSEGARGNLPGMHVHDVQQIADDSFGGDRVDAIDALARIQHQDQFLNMHEYVTAKRVVAWWAAALARRVPASMTVTAVSPGSAPGSNFMRGASPTMKVMIAVMKLVGPLAGMAGSLESAAKRYVDATEFGQRESGHFYATAHRSKLVGPMDKQTWPDPLVDPTLQEAGFDAVVRMTGVSVSTRSAEAPEAGGESR